MENFVKTKIEKPIIIKNPPQFLVDLVQNEKKKEEKRRGNIVKKACF